MDASQDATKINLKIVDIDGAGSLVSLIPIPPSRRFNLSQCLALSGLIKRWRIWSPLGPSLFVRPKFDSVELLKDPTYIDIYHLAFNKDPFRLKAVVYGTYMLETVQTIMGARSIFDSYGVGFLNPESPENVGDLWFSFPILGGIVTCIVELFYAHRILKLGNSFGYSRLAVIIISMLAFTQMGGAFALGVGMRKVMSFTRVFELRTRIPFIIWNGSSALCDILIAIYMTLILTRTKSSFNKTRTIIRKIIRLTIETGTLTASIAILNIVFVVLPGRQPYYQVTSALLSKLYANTLLVLLNSRVELTSGVEKRGESSLSVLNFIPGGESDLIATQEAPNSNG
ncbi:hypothetical protein GALMADRAFT_157591 [Galerina marginata CBS 339.88]|uniref:DUF6534 domain-containing protein n=1 Tax=Galerina marginata (strain CBS 339.88) TaxID=685588 RepID=A0A067SU03_GALM3|nr:hypothetical protein GALMADRAFT_157591 [Galerina marginata CBS 339.88]